MKLDEVFDLTLVWGLPQKFEDLQGDFLLIPEMRPYLLGLSLCERLKELNYPHVYVTDNMLGYLFFKGKIKKTLLFYLKKDKEGFECLNGSLYVVRLSRLHKVPVVFLPGKGIPKGLENRDAGGIDETIFVKDRHAIIKPKIERING